MCFSFFQVKKDDQEFVIRYCMDLTKVPEAPKSGCVVVKYKQGGEVSKAIIKGMVENWYKQNSKTQKLLSKFF